MPAMKPGRVTHTAMVLGWWQSTHENRMLDQELARPVPHVPSGYGSPEAVSPGQDRVHLQLLADYARVDYVRGHRLPRRGLAGVGANLSVALTSASRWPWGMATASMRGATTVPAASGVGPIHRPTLGLFPEDGPMDPVQSRVWLHELALGE